MHPAWLMVALLWGCGEPDPLGRIEAQLGEPIAPEDRAVLPTERGHHVLVLPDRLVVGGFGWDGLELDGEPVLDDDVTVFDERVLPLEKGRVPAHEKRGQLVSALYDALLAQAEVHKDVGMRADAEAWEFTGELWVFVDVRVPGELLREVLFTAGQAQFGNLKLVGVGPRVGAGPPPPADVDVPPDESTRSHPLSPTRVGLIDGEAKYVVDDRGSRIAVDTLAGGRLPTVVLGGDDAMSRVRATPSNPRLYATYAQAAEAARYPVLPSIEMLLHVSKHLDDTLMADLQRAREPARKAWVDTAIAAAADRPLARRWLEAARDLGQGVENPATAAFLALPMQSMPVGIYGEHDDLGRGFRRDRWLAQDLSTNDALRAELAAVLAHPDVARGIAEERAHRAVWTNPAYQPSIEQGGVFLLSGARSHETAWVDAQGGTSAVPEPMEAWIAAIRKGETGLALRDDSGWYDHAQWALEPLLTLPDPIDARDGYRERLKRAFTTGVALRRETQVKDLALPAIGAGASTRLQARVAPELRVEPVPTHLERSAALYGWLLEHALSRGELPDASGWPGRVEAMRDRYAAVAAISRVDLGLGGGEPMEGEAPERSGLPRFGGPLRGGLWGDDGSPVDAQPAPDPSELAEPEPPETPAHVEEAARWLAQWREDPVLGQDVRVLVPFGPDPDGSSIIAWGVLGVEPLDLVVSYAEPPVVRALGREEVDLQLTERRYTVLVPYFAEVVVRRPSTRAELRALGDRYPMAADLVRALGR